MAQYCCSLSKVIHQSDLCVCHWCVQKVKSPVQLLLGLAWNQSWSYVLHFPSPWSHFKESVRYLSLPICIYLFVYVQYPFCVTNIHNIFLCKHWHSDRQQKAKRVTLSVKWWCILKSWVMTSLLKTHFSKHLTQITVAEAQTLKALLCVAI